MSDLVAWPGTCRNYFLQKLSDEYLKLIEETNWTSEQNRVLDGVYCGVKDLCAVDGSITSTKMLHLITSTEVVQALRSISCLKFLKLVKELVSEVSTQCMALEASGLRAYHESQKSQRMLVQSNLEQNGRVPLPFGWGTSNSTSLGLFSSVKSPSSACHLCKVVHDYVEGTEIMCKVCPNKGCKGRVYGDKPCGECSWSKNGIASYLTDLKKVSWLNAAHLHRPTAQATVTDLISPARRPTTNSASRRSTTNLLSPPTSVASIPSSVRSVPARSSPRLAENALGSEPRPDDVIPPTHASLRSKEHVDAEPPSVVESELFSWENSNMSLDVNPDSDFLKNKDHGELYVPPIKWLLGVTVGFVKSKVISNASEQYQDMVRFIGLAGAEILPELLPSKGSWKAATTDVVVFTDQTKVTNRKHLVLHTSWIDDLCRGKIFVDPADHQFLAASALISPGETPQERLRSFLYAKRSATLESIAATGSAENAESLRELGESTDRARNAPRSTTDVPKSSTSSSTQARTRNQQKIRAQNQVLVSASDGNQATGLTRDRGSIPPVQASESIPREPDSQGHLRTSARLKRLGPADRGDSVATSRISHNSRKKTKRGARGKQ